jgi:hypothetical protein
MPFVSWLSASGLHQELVVSDGLVATISGRVKEVQAEPGPGRARKPDDKHLVGVTGGYSGERDTVPGT